MAVSAVWRLVYLLAEPYPLEPRSMPKHTGGTRCAPLLKSKSKLLLVSLADLPKWIAGNETDLPMPW